jgi:hypothetical protein
VRKTEVKISYLQIFCGVAQYSSEVILLLRFFLLQLSTYSYCDWQDNYGNSYVRLEYKIFINYILKRRSQCPRCLRRRSAAVFLLGLWVRIPPEAWMSVCCECCILSGSLCNGPITHSEASYRVWCVGGWFPYLKMRMPWHTRATEPWKKRIYIYIYGSG